MFNGGLATMIRPSPSMMIIASWQIPEATQGFFLREDALSRVATPRCILISLLRFKV